MNICKSMKIIEKYAECPNCKNDRLGNGQGGLIVDDDTVRRFCKCGWDITGMQSSVWLGNRLS